MQKLLLLFCFILVGTAGFSQSPITQSENIYGTGQSEPPEEYYIYNGKYYFHVLDGHDLRIYELDSTSGTSSIIHTQHYSQVSHASLLGGVGNKISFWVTYISNQTQFWTYDISSGNFENVLNTQQFAGYFYKATFNNSICFLARYHNNTGGYEVRLYRAPIDIGLTESPLVSPVGIMCDASSEGCPIVFNDRLLFLEDYTQEPGSLFLSDGNIWGTASLVNIVSGAPNRLTASGNRVFLFSDRASSDNYDELWITDATTAGTSKVADLPNLSGWSYNNTAACGNNLIFRYQDIFYGNELWVSDGTASGTHVLKDIAPAEQSSYPEELMYMGNNKLLFTTGFNTLWVTNGTSEGTEIIKVFENFVSPLIELNGKAFLMADDATNGTELWISDGTTEGTYKIMPPTSVNSPIDGFSLEYRTFLGKFYFQANYDGTKKWYCVDSNISNEQTQNEMPALSAYPNPVVDYLTLSSTEPCIVTISNLSGNILYTLNLDGMQTIDVSTLLSGMYFVHGSNGESLFFIKSE